MFRVRSKRKKRSLCASGKALIKPTVNIIIPCHNEAKTLAVNIQTLLRESEKQLKQKVTITIVDSASSDDTLRIAKKLSKKYSMVQALHVDQAGRGLAIRKAILQSKTDIIAYMDEDLSTDLSALPSLIDPLIK